MLLNTFIKSTRNLRTPNCSTDPNQPNSQILFHTKRPPEDFVKRLWNQGTLLQQYCTVYYYVLGNERKQYAFFSRTKIIHTTHVFTSISIGLEFEFQVDDSNHIPIKYRLFPITNLFTTCKLGWFKNTLSSQTEKLMAATNFSDYLDLKHYKKANKIKYFIHLALAYRPQSFITYHTISPWMNSGHRLKKYVLVM